MSAHAQTRKRPHMRLRIQLRIAKPSRTETPPRRRPGPSCERSNDAPTRQFSPITVFARNLRERADHRVDPDLHIRVDRYRLRLFDRDAVQHQLANLARAQDAIRLRQFHPIIDAQQFARIRQSSKP